MLEKLFEEAWQLHRKDESGLTKIYSLEDG